MKRRVLVQNALLFVACLAIVATLDHARVDKERRSAVRAVALQAADEIADHLLDVLAGLEAVRANWAVTPNDSSDQPITTWRRKPEVMASFARLQRGTALQDALASLGARSVEALVVLDETGTIQLARARSRAANGHLLPFVGKPAAALLPTVPEVVTLPDSTTIVGIPWGRAPTLERAVSDASRRPTRWYTGIGIRLSPPPAPAAAADHLRAAWLLAVIDWAAFQHTVIRSTALIQGLGYADGYSYIIDADADRVIGHVRPGFIGTSLSTFHTLESLSREIGLGANREHDYYLRGDATSKAAFVAHVRNSTGRDVDKRIPAALRWAIGTGVTNETVWREVASRLAYVVPFLTLVWLGGYLFTRWYINVTEDELIEQIGWATVALSSPTAGPPTIGAGARGSRLETSLKALLEKVRERQAALGSASFETVPNPYIVGSPLHTPHVFFDREPDVQWALEHLERPGNELLCFSGARRIGKTSLLHRLRHHQVGGSRVFINAQRILPSILSDTHFYGLLGKGIADGLQGQTQDADLLAAFRRANTSQELSAAFRAMPAGLRPLVLLIDELQALESCLEQGFMTDQALRWLGSELEADDVAVSIVTTGSSGWAHRPKSAWRELQPRTVDRRVTLLPRADAEALITRPAPKVYYAPDAVNAILVFTGGHPYLTQDVCFRVVRWVNKHESYTVTVDTIADVTREIETEPPHVLTETWRTLGSASRHLLTVAAALIAAAEARVTIDHLSAGLIRIGQARLGASRPRMRVLLRGLSQEDLLTVHADDSVAFRCDIWRRWLRCHQPLPQKRREEQVYEEQSV